MLHKTIAGIVFAFLAAFPAEGAELRLTVEGVRSDRGELLIALYDSATGFANALANAAKRGLMPDAGRLVGTSLRAKAGTQSTVFTQLPPGRYAVVVVHDENDNGRLDENALGMPIEGYGFGNDAQGFLSAPSFDAAAISVGSAHVSTGITLIYPGGPAAEDRSDYDRLLGNSGGGPSR